MKRAYRLKSVNIDGKVQFPQKTSPAIITA